MATLMKLWRVPTRSYLASPPQKKYFGLANPIGKTLEIGSSGSLNSEVSGVFKDFPQNTHISFDLALAFSTFEKVWGPTNLWLQMPSNYSYLRMIEGQRSSHLLAKLPQFASRHVGAEMAQLDQNYKMNLQPISSIHLNSHLQKEAEPNASISSIYLLGFIAFLVLIIACINYVNYSTARFSKRAKEVGLRKVIGAGRAQLMGQFLLETFIIAAMAGVAAFLLAELFLPNFNHISGKSFVAADLNHILLFGSLSILVVLIAFGAGIFPALFLASFKPIEVLRGRFANFSIPNLSRKYLVTLQFAASIILLVATMVVYFQMQFVRQQFQPDQQEQVALFQVNATLNEKYKVLKEEMLKIPGVLNVSASSNMPTFYGDSWPVQRRLNGPEVQTENFTIENDFLVTLGFELIAGRDLNKERTEDLEAGFILNETAVKRLELGSPEQAVGQNIYWGSDDKKKGSVVGVIKDFHFQSLHDPIAPALIQFSPYSWMNNNFVATRIKASNFASIQSKIEHIVEQLDPKWVADIRFLDANFERIHQKDIQQGRIFGAFAVLAILISCLGLMGLMAFAAERRTKEIGIRKVLGASVPNIMALLTKEFLRLIVIALVFALPTSWWLMKNWLSNFAYHIQIPLWVFALSGASILLLAILTISFQSIKAALINPVDSLRSE